MGFSPERCTRWLQEIIDEGSWVALCFDDPEAAGIASELTGSGYVRKRARFSDISNKTLWVNHPLAWAGLPQSRLTHIAGYDAQFIGEIQWSCPLRSPARVLEGKGYTIPANQIVLSFT
jgi:hypothetical protein